MTTTFDGAVFDDDAQRRGLVQKSKTFSGIDYLEVETAPPANNQLVLRVYLVAPDPPDDPQVIAKVNNALDTLAQQREKFTVSGGVRTQNIKVLAVTRVGDSLAVRVDRPGDFSTYTLTIDSSLLDPFFRQVDFSFKVGCPSHFDCQPRPYCPPEELPPPPPIDYLAKDYDSFRQALIDFLPTIIPVWTERHEADLGMTLLELFAYTGDQLSYYQDAVANEAYLSTARQRISVRRHARLIDYAMHDGLSAATFVYFEVVGDPVILGERQIQVLTPPSALPNAADGIAFDLRGVALDSADAIFEVLLGKDDRLQLHSGLNQISIHAWRNAEAYLPRGATRADLVGDLPLHEGDFLLFEEALGPESGRPEDHNPAHRQVVRLTAVTPVQRDELGPGAVILYTTVEWDVEDALRFPLCVACLDQDGNPVTDVSVARGNLALAYHGRTVVDAPHTVPDPDAERATGLVEAPRGLSKYRFPLAQAPLSFLPEDDPQKLSTLALQDCKPRGALSVWALQQRTARGAHPAILHLTEDTGAPSPVEWQAVTPDLLASDRFATEFVVETDNDNRAILRFGDNQFGMIPLAGAKLTVQYRVGVGESGNVGADTLVCWIADTSAPGLNDVRAVRNPIAAWGGTDPESLERVQQVAPAAFHAETYRAVTEDDYARAAEKHPAVRKAVATFRWTGSWHTVFIAIDPKGTTVFDDLKQSVTDCVQRVALAGYDLEIGGPIFVPLRIDLDVCVKPGYFPSDVEQALLEALSNRSFADGRLGFFHPDKFTFNQPLYLSKLYEAVQQVTGVESVKVTRFARSRENDPDPTHPATQRNLDNGYITTGRLEIIRLDNDLNFPENGTLNLNVRGGL